MHTYAEKDKLLFIGTVKELRCYLQSLRRKKLTLREFLNSQLH